MKITVQIINEPVEITLTDEQIAQIEAQKKPKKFEWSYKHGKSYWISTSYTLGAFSCTDPASIEHGRYRKSEEAAGQSLLRNKRANRLEALAEQLGGLVDFSYTKTSYCIRRNSDYTWSCAYIPGAFSPERVYMTRECAIEICRMLNEGEFSLDGEQ